MNSPYVLILGGGLGTRLWPLSRSEKPKQILSLTSSKSLIEETLKRALLLTKKKNIFIGSSPELKKVIRKKIKGLPNKQFIVEPTPRNTAPIIALFCAFLGKKKKEHLKRPVIVLSADHFIGSNKVWSNSIRSTFPFLDEKIFCLGIVPDRPETGYGYIETGEPIFKEKDHLEVKRFIEKPGLRVVKRYLKTQRYLWNTGIFIFKPELFLKELKKYIPKIYDLALKSVKSKAERKKYFHAMPKISIDYALMEKTKKLAVVKGDFHWDDIGNFLALGRIKKQDPHQNIVSEGLDYKSISSQGNIMISDDKNIKFALLEINDLIVIKNKDLILLAHKRSINQIKELREKYSEKYR